MTGLDEAATGVDVDRWVELARAALITEGVDGGELNLIFVDEAEMASLNAQHMGVDGPTDVLSFPLDSVDEPTPGGTGQVLLGDVVVCPAYAARQAPGNRSEHHDGSLVDELALLVVHGVLHVLGHDHAEPGEAATMRRHERDLLSTHHGRGT